MVSKWRATKSAASARGIDAGNPSAVGTSCALVNARVTDGAVAVAATGVTGASLPTGYFACTASGEIACVNDALVNDSVGAPASEFSEGGAPALPCAPAARTRARAASSSWNGGQPVERTTGGNIFEGTAC